MTKMNFEQWCMDNGRQDILDRWDYEKNDFDPGDIGHASEKKVWLKCSRGIHESEPHSLASLNKGKDRVIECRACNSFAQHVIDLYGEDYLDEIWSDENEFSPWNISHSSKKKVILNVTGITRITEPQHFLKPKGRQTPNDATVTQERSLGAMYPEVLAVWSDKNEKTPYDYWPNSDAEVWWKCENGVHGDYKRRISSSKPREYKCPKCGRLGKGLIDLTGNVYGELTVTGFDKSVDGIPYWWCRCSCGRDVSVRGAVLRIGHTKTCGDGIHYMGENNPNWKGGKKTLNQRIRSSSEYSNWRNAVVEKYKGTSHITGLPLDGTVDLHHIYPMSDYFDLASEEWNTIELEPMYHSMFEETGFHYKYGAKHNTPEQLNEFINDMRKKCGNDEPFDICEFLDNRKKMAEINPIPKPDFAKYYDGYDDECFLNVNR